LFGEFNCPERQGSYRQLHPEVYSASARTGHPQDHAPERPGYGFSSSDELPQAFTTSSRNLT
jgi:hypothetical protein